MPSWRSTTSRPRSSAAPTDRARVAAAAYRSASRLHDERLDRHHDFSNKAGVVHSEVMLPDGAPEHLVRPRSAVERGRGGREADRRAARPRDRVRDPARARPGSRASGWRASSCRREFVDRGMIADLNVHWDIGADGDAQAARACHADHARGGRGRVRREGPRLEPHRAAGALARGVGATTSTSASPSSISMRASITAAWRRRASTSSRSTRSARPHRAWRRRGWTLERLDEHAAIARANGEKILANPELALDAITHHQATFTTRDLAMFVHRHSDGKEQFDRVMAAVQGVAGAGRARQGRARRGAVHQPRR